MISKLIPGGEIRMVKKGDKSSYKGQEKVAGRDYIMIRMVSRKTPIFLDSDVVKVIKEATADEDVQAFMREWS